MVVTVAVTTAVVLGIRKIFTPARFFTRPVGCHIKPSKPIDLCTSLSYHKLSAPTEFFLDAYLLLCGYPSAGHVWWCEQWDGLQHERWAWWLLPYQRRREGRQR